MPHGAAGTGKAAAEQKLLDTAMRDCPHLFTMDRIWLMDRNYPGAARIARLTACARPDPSQKQHPPEEDQRDPRQQCRVAEISGNGVTVTVRVIEYLVTVEGQHVPELFCLVTDLMDITGYPAAELAALYRWRWDGSETALREAKASLDGASPPAGPPPRRGPRPEGAPRRAARPGPRDLPRPHPPRDHRRDPRRDDQLHDAGQGTRETPHGHRPEPAPRPQGQVLQHLPPRRTRGHR